MATREDFINSYCEKSGLEPTQWGYKCGEREGFAVPCDCDYEDCEGWKMMSTSQLAFDKYQELMSE